MKNVDGSRDAISCLTFLARSAIDRSGMDEHLTRDKFSYVFSCIFVVSLLSGCSVNAGGTLKFTQPPAEGTEIGKERERTCPPPSLLRGGK